LDRNIATRLLRGRALLDGGDLDGADRLFQAALAIEPTLASALRARAEIALQRDDPATALTLVQASLGAALAEVPSLAPLPLRILQLGSIHAGGHTNTDRVLNPLWTQTTTLLVEKWDLAWPLPEHDIIVNAIADAYICGPALDLAEYLTATSEAPVVNAPARVRATTRTENVLQLSGIEGLRIPRVERITREAAANINRYPALLRAPGYHNGAFFEMLHDDAERDAAIAALPPGDLLWIEYVDARGADGAFRKYRAMAVEGALYPAHLAIGEVWKLHYFSATMNDERRAEEVSYLSDMRGHLGDRAFAALEAIAARLKLEYVGIDFGIDANGDVILFEANAAMTVFLPEDEPQNALRRAAVFSIDGALYDLISRLVAG